MKTLRCIVSLFLVIALLLSFPLTSFAASAAAPSVTVNATRSAGTIGGDGAAISNTWSGQKLYIYACQKDSKTGITMSDRIADLNTYALRDEEGTVGTGDKISGVKWKNDESRYFPRSGAYDFFGFFACFQIRFKNSIKQERINVAG